MDENGDVIPERDRRNKQEQDAQNAPNLGQNNGLNNGQNSQGNGVQNGLQDNVGGNNGQGNVNTPNPDQIHDATQGADAAPTLNNPNTPGAQPPTQKPPGRTIASNEPPKDGEFLEEFAGRNNGVINGLAREKLVRKDGIRDAQNPVAGKLVNENGKFFLDSAVDRINIKLPTGKEQATIAELKKLEGQNIMAIGKLNYITDPKLKEQGAGRANYSTDGPKFAKNSEYDFDLADFQAIPSK